MNRALEINNSSVLTQQDSQFLTGNHHHLIFLSADLIPFFDNTPISCEIPDLTVVTAKIIVFYLEVRGKRFFQNVGPYLPHYMTSHPRRQNCIYQYHNLHYYYI